MNNSCPRLSVVVPTYNRAMLVDRCLGSLRRGGVPDLEVVVVDDGGTDHTATVATDHGAVYIRQENAGPAAARNTGFAATAGRYVAFIDSDDEWTDGGAARLLAQMEANSDIGMAFGDALMGNSTDGFVSFVRTYGTDSFFRLPHVLRPGGVRLLDRRAFFRQLSTRNVMFLGSTLIRRDLFARIEGFDRSLRGAADWDLFMRAAVAGVTAYSEGPAVSRYYKHSEGMSTDTEHMEEDFIRALDSVRRRSALDASERRHVDERLRAHAFGWAWQAYDSGDVTKARERLLLARRLGQMKAREISYLLSTYLPRPVVSTVRQLRQGLERWLSKAS
jgi:glycosyltransferase involved in cell wall biosynthesis